MEANQSLDANGNTTASNVGGETFGFGYNGRNRLTVVQRNGSTVGTYTYNALGQRVGKVATFPASVTQYYLYDENSQLLGEYGDATRDYIWLDGIPVAMSDTVLRGGLSFSVQTTTNYVHADGLNTPPLGLWSLSVQAYLGGGGGVNMSWSNGTFELTGQIGVGVGGGLAWDPNGSPSPRVKSCGSDLIARTTFNANAGLGFPSFAHKKQVETAI